MYSKSEYVYYYKDVLGVQRMVRCPENVSVSIECLGVQRKSEMSVSRQGFPCIT